MPLTLQMQQPEPNAKPGRAPLNIHASGTGFPEGLSPSRAARVENVLTPEQHKALVQYATSATHICHLAMVPEDIKLSKRTPRRTPHCL